MIYKSKQSFLTMLNFFKLLLIIILLSNLLSCSNDEKKINFLDKNLSAKEKIKWILRDENSSVLNIDDSSRIFLKQLYKKNNYNSFWINDTVLLKNGKEIQKLLKNPLLFGLPDNRVNLNFNDSTNLIIQEILLSKTIASIHFDLKNGFFDTLTKQQNTLSYSVNAKEILNLSKIKNHKNIPYEIIKWGPKDTNYQKLALSHFDFVSSCDFKDKNLHVVSYKKDSIQAKNLTTKALVQKGFLKENEKDSLSFSNALQSFQIQNGLKDDGVIGQNTVDALNETNLEKSQRSALVLEKLRKQKIEVKKYVIINVPEFTLRFYADDSLKSVNRIVVGKFENKTPEFSSEINRIVAFPYWNVPYSITSKEILPDAKRNPNYFARNHMKIYKKDEEIDPLTVDWKAIREKTFPYRVVQQPGYHNSLGIIKFEFNNKFGVYVHDTPSKSLFNTDIRSYSHGCMRCENPVSLAKTILIKDKNRTIPDSLESIISRKKNHPIHLKNKIPIYIVYQSVVTKNNQLIFLRDIYKRDKRLAKYLFNSSQK